MPSRLVLRNRVVWWSRDFPRVDWGRGVPRDREGRVVDCATAIPPSSPASPFRAGVTLFDREDGIAYRCVERLDPLDGWASTEFWQQRWDVDHRAIVRYVEHGMLDAAVEAGSRVSRFRCRDEHRLLQSRVHAAQRARVEKRRDRAKIRKL